MALRPLGFTLAAALALLPAALPAAPYLVKDLNTSPSLNRGQGDLADRGTGPGVSYFAATDPAHGAELWRSDGTPGGTATRGATRFANAPSPSAGRGCDGRGGHRGAKHLGPAPGSPDRPDREGGPGSRSGWRRRHGLEPKVDPADLEATGDAPTTSAPHTVREVPKE